MVVTSAPRSHVNRTMMVGDSSWWMDVKSRLARVCMVLCLHIVKKNEQDRKRLQMAASSSC